MVACAMTISTLSPQNQTTLSVEFVRRLKLHAGMKFRQSVKNGKIILQPVPDVFTAFGSLKSKRKFVSIEEETEGMEKAIGKQVASKGRKP
jgi:hypothetical protein